MGAGSSRNAIERRSLLALYGERRLSMAEIAARLRCSVHKVVYWMDRHGIARRSRSEATRVKRNRRPPYVPKKRLTVEDERLKALALGLFLGEGNRRARNIVRLGNTDPLVLRFFVRFLRRVCGVPWRKIRVNLLVHPDVVAATAERFWSAALGIPREQFQKTSVLRPRGGGTYRYRCEYGVATVIVCSIDLRNQIQEWIEAQAASAGVAQW